jgi:hypothetical protein
MLRQAGAPPAKITTKTAVQQKAAQGNGGTVADRKGKSDLASALQAGSASGKHSPRAREGIKLTGVPCLKMSPNGLSAYALDFVDRATVLY